MYPIYHNGSLESERSKQTAVMSTDGLLKLATHTREPVEKNREREESEKDRDRGDRRTSLQYIILEKGERVRESESKQEKGNVAERDPNTSVSGCIITKQCRAETGQTGSRSPRPSGAPVLLLRAGGGWERDSC